MEERHRQGIPAPLMRIITACVVLFAGWLLFAQIAPRMLMHLHPESAVLTPPQQLSASPAAAPQIPASAPAPEKTDTATPEPVQLKPLKAEEAAPETKPAETPKAAELNTSAEKLQELEAKIAEQAKAIEALQHDQKQALHTISLMDAYDRLDARVRSGQPYAAELDQLHVMAMNDAALSASLTTLETNAKKGIPPLDALQHDFNHSIHLALQPQLPPDAGFFARLEANLSQSISIRRVGDVPGNTNEAVIARAESALMHNDVPHAIAELSGLQPQAAQAMRPWIDEATAYTKREEMLLAVKNAIAALSLRSS